MQREQKAAVVLMLEDDPDIVNVARLKFEHIHGHDFRATDQVDEAIEIVKRTEGEIVAFVDVHLGFMDKSSPLGLKFMRWCHQHVPHRVVIYAMTSDRSSGVRLTALKSGAVTVFYKDMFDSILEFMDVLVDHAEVSVVKGALHREWIDPLTGFWNIGGFRKQVLPQLEVARPRDNQVDGVDRRDRKRFGQFSLLFIEVEIEREELDESEDYGLNDKVIATFSNIVRAHVRPTDHLCRAGENVLLALLPDASQEHARKIASEIREEAKQVRILDATTPTLKIGVDHLDRDDLGPEPMFDLELLITKARSTRR